MLAEADLSMVAELISGHRAGILLALLGGSALSAGELARRAGISPSLASSHLSRLLDGGLIAVEQHGRRREYRVASPQVAEALEAMLRIAPMRSATGLRESTRGQALRRARTCYDHLAGEVGVAITDSLQHQGMLHGSGDAYELTQVGERRLLELGLKIESLRAKRRAFARPCLDWTERRPHLAGSLGAAIAQHALQHDWLTRVPGTRAVRVTDIGALELRRAFGLNVRLPDGSAEQPR